MNIPTMTMKKIADAAPHELRKYAADVLNLDLTGSESDAEVLALVQRAQPGNENIFVEQTPVDDEAPLTGSFDTINHEEAGRVTGSLGRSDPRVVINIPFQGEDNIGRADVAVGVNGVIWQIKRNHNVTVPWRVVVALGLTVQDIVRHDMEKDEVIITPTMRFPVTFPEGRPDPAVIEAWMERTAEAFCP